VWEQRRRKKKRIKDMLEISLHLLQFTGLVAHVDKELLPRKWGYRERSDDDCADSYLRGSYG
jgi:hypothetical protein